MSKKPDTRAVGLDVGLAFIKWLTGAENLHYGDWTGLEVNAGNLRRAQEAYTERLFAQLPAGPCRILDIGGGAGETARKLIALGHSVDIVVPSAFLAERCRQNAPAARVHECKFEDLQAAPGSFDLCLFSESFQYIPYDFSLPRCLTLLAPGGQILIADCFRSEGFRPDTVRATVGGGHRIGAYRKALAAQPLDVVHEEDITDRVAPSVDLEQQLFNVFGYAIGRIDTEFSRTRPGLRRLVAAVFRLMMSARKRTRLSQRLNEQSRNATVFKTNNTYLIQRLQPRR